MAPETLNFTQTDKWVNIQIIYLLRTGSTHHQLPFEHLSPLSGNKNEKGKVECSCLPVGVGLDEVLVWGENNEGHVESSGEFTGEGPWVITARTKQVGGSYHVSDPVAGVGGWVADTDTDTIRPPLSSVPSSTGVTGTQTGCRYSQGICFHRLESSTVNCCDFSYPHNESLLQLWKTKQNA